MSEPLYSFYYALDEKQWSLTAGGDEILNPVDFIIRQDATFAIRFTTAGAVVELGTVTAWEFNIKRRDEFSDVDMVYTTTGTKVGTGTSTVYNFAPDCGGTELVAAMGVKRKVQCALQIDYTIGGVLNKTMPLDVDILNDYAEDSAPTIPVTDAFVRVNATTDVLTSPTAAEFYAANPPTGGGGSSDVGNTVTVDAVFGDNDTGTREGLPFETITAAKAVALSGDTIVARSGTYTDTGIQKTGVVLDLSATTLVRSASTLASVFTDAGGAFSQRAVAGDVSWTGEAAATTDSGFLSTIANNSSALSLSVNNVTHTVGQLGNVISSSGGKTDVNFNRIETTGSGIWWSNGDLNVTGDRLHTGVYCIWSLVPAGATMTGKFWVNVNYLFSDQYHPVDSRTSDGSTGNAQIYVRALEMSGVQGGVFLNGCKTYVQTQKLACTAVDVAVISMAGGEGWIEAQKVQGSPLIATTSGSAGKLVVSIDDWQDANGGTDYFINHSGEDIGGTGANIYLRGGVLRAVTANGLIAGGYTGEIHLSGTYDFSAVAGSNPIYLYDDNTTIYFDGNPRLIAYAGRDSILADVPVTVYGHFITNRPIHANVTAEDGYTLDDGAGNVTEFLPAIVKSGGVVVPTISSTNTLTNKTISGASNTITNVSLTTGVTGTLPIANGGTGATTAADARTAIGLGTASTLSFFNEVAELVFNSDSTTDFGGNVWTLSGGELNFGTGATINIGGSSPSTNSLLLVSDAGVPSFSGVNAGLIPESTGFFISSAGATLTVPITSNITLTGTGTIATGSFTLTVPATGTAALRDVANTFSNTTSAASSTTGALIVGNGTAATSVGIGGGNINAGGALTTGGIATFGGQVRAGNNSVTTTNNLNICSTGSTTNVNTDLRAGALYGTSDFIIKWNSQASGAVNIFGGGSVHTTISSPSAGVVQIGTNAANALGTINVAVIAVTGATTLAAAVSFTPNTVSPGLNAGGIIATTATSTVLAINGNNALTLADGTTGQIRTIVCGVVTAAGTATLSPTTTCGFTSVAFTAVGQSVVLQFFTTYGWAILSVRGATVT